MLDVVQAVAGWAITWLMIIAFPSLGAALGGYLFPRWTPARALLGAGGFAVVLAVVWFLPEPPPGASWVDEYSFHFQTYYATWDGITKAFATVVGIYALFVKVRGKIKSVEAESELSGS